MWYMYTRLLEPDQISHTQSMVANRGCTNQANVHTPMGKSRLKHSTAIDPTIFAAIGHRFMAQRPETGDFNLALSVVFR